MKIQIHRCHAGCGEPCAPRKLMCRECWAMVPKQLQDAVCAEYVPGQERTKQPTKAWVRAALAAIRWVRDLRKEAARV